MQLKDKVIYTPTFVWGIFEYDDTQDAKTWNLHSICWNRKAARFVAKLINEKTIVRKVAFQVIEKDHK